jgi:flagellar hook-associated protein 3 FlgL
MRTIGPTFLYSQIFQQNTIRQNQVALANAQQELATQRHSDVSLKLAGNAGRNIRWHADLANLETNIQSNSLHEARANITQTSLQTASTLASDFLKNLLGSRSALGGQEIIQEQAKNMMEMFKNALNVDIDGVFLFGGRNQSIPPMNEYAGSTSQTQFSLLFQADVGASHLDPAVANVTASQLEIFLSGSFQNLFSSPTWESTISNASSENVLAQVNDGEKIDVLANANEEPVRKLYEAMLAISELATGNLNDSAFKKLVDIGASKVSSAMQGLADIQARVGLNQKSLSDATNQLKSRKSWIDEAILKSETVDTYEVATRINGLMSQLEASYSVTSRISRISLLNYL